jgi:putative colanic acid biosynthesis glycosyltransferase WcaI
MKVLIVGLNFWPETVGCAKYTAGLADYLSVRGHDVRIVTGAPYYPQWRHYEGWPRFRYKRDIFTSPTRDASFRDVEVTYCPHYVPSRPTGLTRLLHLASFGISSLPVLLLRASWRPQVVISVAPTLISSLGALLCARLSRATAVLHVQDFELDAAFELGLFSQPFLRNVASRLEATFLRRFDLVSTISSRMLERLLAKGVPKERAILFANGVDTNAIFPLDQPSALRKELAIASNRIVALYSGTMSLKQGLESIVEVARLDAMQDIDFVLCGEGPARNGLVAAAQGMRNVRFLPLQPVERLNDLLNLADIHLLPQKADVEDLVLPSKLTGMLASGRPIVAWANEGTAISAAIQDCGIAVPPGNLSALAEELARLANNEIRRRHLGRTARQRAVDELSVEKIHLAYEQALRTSAASGLRDAALVARTNSELPLDDEEERVAS